MDQHHLHTNDLITETSPYLIQHAHNPINWKPWKKSSFKKATVENKLIIVSIGYAACHWCHVMERESFENPIVANVMNKHFVSIKVDREERPDIDHAYMNAVQLMSGSAGWPLNVITLPDGRPIWGGTYFPKNNWVEAIKQVHQLYITNSKMLEEYATKLEKGIKTINLISLNPNSIDFSRYNTSKIMEAWSASFDTLLGGTRGAPKFMMPCSLSYLLKEGANKKEESLIKQGHLTLKKIAYGGVYDHIGGGFSRYSTDEKWHIPHFEKMLYDNAQLVSLYSNAYLMSKNPLYKEVVTETLAFIAREMTAKEGAFYSSLDADSISENNTLEEGVFYTYTPEELEKIVPKDFNLFKAYYNINEYGKWKETDTYVLIRNKDDLEITTHFSISYKELQEKKKKWKASLLQYRNKRPKPRLDDKSLTSWNSLMLKGYVDAYKAFQRKEYLDSALKNGAFILTKQMQDNGALFHTYKEGKSNVNGFLEDYALTIDSFISLYEVTLDEKWIKKAKKMTDYTFAKFYNPQLGMFHFTSQEDTERITRTIEYRDNVIPASNSVMANNLLTLSFLFYEKKYSEAAKQMLKNVIVEMESYPEGFTNWLDLLSKYRYKYYQIVVVGKDALEKIEQLHQFFLPQKLIIGSTKESNLPLLKGKYSNEKTAIFVCYNTTCKLPVTSVEEAIALIKKEHML